MCSSKNQCDRINLYVAVSISELGSLCLAVSIGETVALYV